MKDSEEKLILKRVADPSLTPAAKERGRGPQKGIGLCLSGGGYRAMLFHVGSLWRLLEMGYLARLDRISSVSGGSITAATLGLHWEMLSQENWTPRAFRRVLVDPIRSLAGKTIDINSVLLGALLPGTINRRLVNRYRRELFGDATLQDLPNQPRFTINATNVGSGVLWRFAKPYMWDYRVGEVLSPKVSLALAVAASSAFPPVLSPAILPLDPKSFTAGSGDGLEHPPYTKRAVLTDGGVYDNLGLEPVWKRYQTILVSDAGLGIKPEPRPKMNWLCHIMRVVNIIDNQVLSLRKRLLIEAYNAQMRSGTYWGIGSDITHYKVKNALPCPFPSTQVLAHFPTRLAAVAPVVQERLINWGYAVCDAAMRRWVEKDAAAPASFPYPAAGVG